LRCYSAASRGRDASGVVVGDDAESLWGNVEGAISDVDVRGSSAVVVLVKGSRGMRMDYIVEQLTRTTGEEGEGL
jgi:UDP-N-acetylmuramyl pentapeptide synthase